MSCAHEQDAVVYARVLRESMDLLGKLYNEYTDMAAAHAVVPSPHIASTMEAFANLYIVTRTTHPVPIDDDDEQPGSLH